MTTAEAIKNRIIKTELVDIDKLTPFQGKLKTLDDKNFNKLRKSIIEEGFSFTVHVWENGGVTYIIDGHQRVSVLTQMRKQGIEIPPISCSFVSAGTYRDAKKLVLLAISQYGKIQKDGFLDFVDGEDFDFGDYDFPDLSFDLNELFEVKAESDFDESKEDDVPDDAPSRVQPGDIWQLGDHRLMCGDSTSKDDVQSLFGKEKAKLCFTSPPYSDQREYRGGKELSTEKLAKFISVAANSVELFAVNLGISRKEGQINCYWDDYIKEANGAGLKLLSWNIWDRSGAGFTVGQISAMFAIEHEWIFIFGKKPEKLNLTIENKLSGESAWGVSSVRGSDGGLRSGHDKGKTRTHRQLGTIFKSDIARNFKQDSSSSSHPAQFPVEFPTSYIEACTNPGDWVHEPFCGSGTTIIACEKTGRKCFGMELDPHYCDIIITRWETLTGKRAERISSGR